MIQSKKLEGIIGSEGRQSSVLLIFLKIDKTLGEIKDVDGSGTDGESLKRRSRRVREITREARWV